MTLFYGSIRSTQFFIETLVQIDDKLVSLKKVMDQDTNFDEMLKNATDQAYEFGRSIDGALESMETFAKMGFDQLEVEALGKNAQLLATIGEMSDSDAAEYLTSALLQFNMAAEDSIKIVNSWNEVSNNFAVTSLDLAQAIARSGQAASNVNVTFDELNGMVATIQASTRRGGSQIGNSLRTIFTRLNMESTQEALKSIGVEVLDTAGNFRRASDIFEDVAEKTKDMEQSQKSYIMTSMAGQFHVNNLMALLNQYSMAQEAATRSMDSYNSAANELATYQESLSFRMQNLQTAFQELALTIGDAVLTDAVITTVEAMRDMTEASMGLVRHIGALAPVLGTVGMALLPLSPSFKKAVMEMRIFQASAVGLTASLNGLKIAFRGILAATGVGIVFAGIGFALEKLIGVMARAKTRNQELERNFEASAQSMQNSRDRIDELVDAYDKLSKIDDKTTDEQQKYVDIQNELAQLLPTIKIGEDEKGNAIISNTSIIEDNIAALERQLELQHELARAEAPKTIIDNKSVIDENKKEIKELESDLEKRTQDYLNDLENGASKYQVSLSKKWVDRVQADLTELQNENNELMYESEQSWKSLFSTFDGLSSTDIQWLADLGSQGLIDPYNTEQVEKLADKIAVLKAELGKDFSLEGLSLESLPSITKVNRSIQEGYEHWEVYRKELLNTGIESSRVGDILGRLRNSEEDVSAAASEMGITAKNAVPVFDDLGNIINFTTENIEDQEEAVDELLESYNNAVSTIKDLNGVINELNEGNGVSADTISMLMEKYPDLLQYIGDEVVLRREIQKAIEREAEVSRQALIQKLQNNEDFFNKVLKGNADFFNKLQDDYGIDLSNFKSLAKAKQEIEMTLLKNLADQWGKYYRIQADGTAALYGANVDNLMRGAMQGSEEANSILVQMNKQVKAYNSIVDGLNSVTGNTIPVNFSSIGFKSPSSSDSSSGSSKESKTQEDALKELQKQREEYADNSVDLLKNAIEQRIKLLEAERDREIKMLDERAEAYDQYVDDKLEAMRRENEQQDFNKQQQELLDERTRLQQQIDILSLNDTESANARRQELQQELQDIMDQLSDLQTDRSRDLREQTIKDEQEKYHEQLDVQRSAIEQRYESELHYLQELSKNEEYYATLRQQVIEGNVKNINNAIKSYLDDFKKYNQSIVEDLGASWQELQNLTYQFNTLKDSTPSGSSGSNSSSSNSSDSKQKRYYTVQAGDTLSAIAEKYYSDWRKWEKIALANGISDPSKLQIGKKLLIPYHQGGIVGQTTNRLAELANQLFNVDPNEQVIRSLKGELQVPPQNIPNIFKTFSGLVNLPAKTVTPDGQVININIDKVIGTDRNTANQFGGYIKDYIKRSGG